MALRQIRIGSLPNIGQYDDSDYPKSMEVEDPISCTGAPIAPNDLVRLDDLASIALFPNAVANIDDPTELNALAGTEGTLVLAYKVVAATGQDQYTIYAYDTSGPAVNSPYVVDAAGAGAERWIAIAGKYRISTILNTLAAKNPPIDADKAVYRDSTAGDVLVTSTWTQVKAFLKIYFDTLYGTLGAAHAQLHSIISTSDHSSAATSGQMLKADANGLPINATNTDAQVSAAVSASHSNALDHPQGTDTALGAVGTKNPPIDADKTLYRDSTTADALVTSTWTQVKAFLKTYFDGLYDILGATSTHSALTTGVHGVGGGTVAKVADIATDGNLSAAAQAVVTAGACDVDANLSVAAQAAISASHAQSHTVASHSDANLGAIAANDLMQWDDPSSKWLPKSIAEVILSQNINPGPITIGTVEDWRYAVAIADDGHVDLPTIKANYAAKCEVIISSFGVIDANAIFMIDSTGTVTPQVDSGNCVYNIDTDVKLCIGTAAAQNPLTIKYRLGSAVAKIMITMKYVKA